MSKVLAVVAAYLCPEPSIVKLYVPKAQRALYACYGDKFTDKDIQDAYKQLEFGTTPKDVEEVNRICNLDMLKKYVEDTYTVLVKGDRYTWEEICAECPYRYVFLSDVVYEGQANVDKYNNAAMNAVKSGEDDDARKLLAKKQEAMNTLTEKQGIYEVAKANADKMRQMHDKLVSDIQSLEQRKDSIKSKVAVARAQEHINDINAGDKAASSISAFERMEAKANKQFDAAMAKAELNEGPKDETDDLAKKYAAGGSSSVEEELAAMKAALGK